MNSLDRFVALGAYTRPASTFEGGPRDPELSPAVAWKVARELWAGEIPDRADG
jgi:hypothetical protein